MWRWQNASQRCVRRPGDRSQGAPMRAVERRRLRSLALLLDASRDQITCEIIL
jgi:hypothetical protein